MRRLAGGARPYPGEQCAARRARCEPASARRRAQTDASGGAASADQAPRWRAVGASPKSAPCPPAFEAVLCGDAWGKGGAGGRGAAGRLAPKPRRSADSTPMADAERRRATAATARGEARRARANHRPSLQILGAKNLALIIYLFIFLRIPHARAGFALEASPAEAGKLSMKSSFFLSACGKMWQKELDTRFRVCYDDSAKYQS